MPPFALADKFEIEVPHRASLVGFLSPPLLELVSPTRVVRRRKEGKKEGKERKPETIENKKKERRERVWTDLVEKHNRQTQTQAQTH